MRLPAGAFGEACKAAGSTGFAEGGQCVVLKEGVDLSFHDGRACRGTDRAASGTASHVGWFLSPDLHT